MQVLLKDDIPLPETCIGSDGLPLRVANANHTEFLFTSLLAQTSLRAVLLEACDPQRSNATMDTIKELFEHTLTDTSVVKAIKAMMMDKSVR